MAASALTSGLDSVAKVVPLPGLGRVRISASPRQIQAARERLAAIDVPQGSRSYDVDHTPLGVIVAQLTRIIDPRTPLIEDSINHRVTAVAPPAVLDRIGHLINTLDMGDDTVTTTFSPRFVPPRTV